MKRTVAKTITAAMTTAVTATSHWHYPKDPWSGVLRWGSLALPRLGSRRHNSTVSLDVIALVGSGVQGESVATSPIGRKLFASIAFGVGFRNVSAQVQGVGIALHDSASSGTAYAVFVVPQRLNCSFSWSRFRRDESEIHQDSRNRRQPYRLDGRPT